MRAGLRVAYSPGFPSLVDAEIRAGADRLAAELDGLGAVVEDRLPDPALAGYGQRVENFLAAAFGRTDSCPRADGDRGQSELLQRRRVIAERAAPGETPPLGAYGRLLDQLP